MPQGLPAMQTRLTLTMERGASTQACCLLTWHACARARSQPSGMTSSPHGARRVRCPGGDQDVLNVYLNRHRDQAYVLPCKFNVRWAHLCSPDELRLDFLCGRRFLQGRKSWECQLLRYDVMYFCTEDLRPMPYPSGPHLMAQARPECHCDQAFSLLAVLHSL